jgi:acyl-CoA dehydrogenase
MGHGAMADDLLVATAEELFADTCPPEAVDQAAAGDGWAPQVWQALEQAGMTLLPVPEARGGAGAGLVEAAALLRAAGRHAAPVPLAETALLAGWLLAGAGLDVPSGPLAAAVGEGLTLRRVGDGWRVSGRLSRVPWARVAERLVVLVDVPEPLVLLLDRSAYDVQPGRNVASEPRDEVTFDGAVAAAAAAPGPDATADAFLLRGALGRAVLMSGAAERALDLSVGYAEQRVQFGRPIARFQAVQQHLAEMAGVVAASSIAADAAVRDLQAGAPLARVRVAAAKEQAGRTAGVVARLAHQVHGAIGFTREHVLRQATTRLWAWRDEHGNEQHWARVVGEQALRAGADGLWPQLTSDEERHG